MIEFNITNAPPINFDAGSRQGPAGPDGNATSIPANTAIGNFTNGVALPTARTREEWLAWLQVATDAELAEAISAERYRISGPPTQILSGETYFVPERRQVLFTLPISIESGGTLQIDGDLIEV